MSQTRIRARVSETGRLSIPAPQRKLLGLEQGGTVVLTVEDGKLTLQPVAKLLADIQSEVSLLVPKQDGQTVERFLAERRQEAQRDEG